MLLVMPLNVSVVTPAAGLTDCRLYIAMLGGMTPMSAGQLGMVDGTTDSTFRSWTWPVETSPEGRIPISTSSCLSVILYVQNGVPPNVTAGTSSIVPRYVRGSVGGASTAASG